MSDANLTATQSQCLEMFILDVLRHDIEQVKSIVNLLNNDGCIGWRDRWDHDFTAAEVASVLPRLVREGYLDLYGYSESDDVLVALGAEGYLPENYAGNEGSFWYLLTAKGKSLWESWEPPT